MLSNFALHINFQDGSLKWIMKYFKYLYSTSIPVIAVRLVVHVLHLQLASDSKSLLLQRTEVYILVEVVQDCRRAAYFVVLL